MQVRSRTHTVVAGKITQTKLYTAEMIDTIAVYDKTTDRCFYVPVADVEGKDDIRLRLVPAKNGQVKGVRWATDYGQLV